MTVHPLVELFERVGKGVYPPNDGVTECMPRPPGTVGAVLAFTGHCVVASDVDAEWVTASCPPGDLTAPLAPDFVAALARSLGCTPSTTRLVLWAPGEEGQPVLPLVRSEPEAVHPRIVRAHRYRSDVRVYRTLDGMGLLTIGRGLAGRWEAGFEVAVGQRGRGMGRALAISARRMICAGEPLFMQVAVGNVASLRAVLAGGFVPVGAEILFERGEEDLDDTGRG